MHSSVFGFLAVGAILIVLGFLTWKKQTLAFMHSYHYNFKDLSEDVIPAYTKQMGICQIVVGAGFVAAGLLKLVSETASWPVLIIGLAAGLFIMHKAQMKYVGSWFKK